MQVLDPENGTALARQERSSLEIATSRAAQEVQAAMVVAKKFPRDINAAYARILQGCKRRALAEQSAYAYPRGGTKVTGPSIRLAEHLAQNWGNFESGVIELERRDGESLAMAYAWDLETNSRDVKVFTIEHVREKSEAKGGNQKLSDPRDIYELVANQGARRKRACILALIPGDIVDAAEAECDKTLKGDNTEPLIDRVRKMAAAFVEISVTTEMLEKRLGHVLDATNENELVSLRKVFSSLRDGMSKREDWFPTDPAEQPTGKSSFGFQKATDPPKTPPPDTSQAANAQPAATQTAQEATAEPSPDEQAAIRQQEQAEASQAGQPGVSEASDRATLIKEIVSLQDKRKMSARDRVGLQRKFTSEPLDKAPIEALEKLRSHLRMMTGTLV
ncbi:MAG TPA: hypothetical protein P5144_10330 [Thermoanaerobaculia bacterium]|nr:hypothetical protein [Thermoanaerobaculia bacterium]